MGDIFKVFDEKKAKFDEWLKEQPLAVRCAGQHFRSCPFPPDPIRSHFTPKPEKAAAFAGSFRLDVSLTTV